MPEIVPNDPGFLTKTSLIQLGYGVWVNLTMIVIGLTFGFTAVALPQLSKPDSVIPTTVSDRSWITSVLTILSPIGCVVTGYLVDKIGRRLMLMLCHVPVAIGWFFTGIATSTRGLIIARMITGFGLGMIVVAPRPYMSEISLPNMRGVIGTFQNLALSIGVVIQAGLGSYFKWQTLCYISMSYSLILMLCNYFLPETPHYLLMTSTIEHAEASLRKFRGPEYDIASEVEELRIFKRNNNIRSLTWSEKVVALFKPSACKPFGIVVVYFIFTQSSGISIMTMSTVEILQNSKSTVNPHTGNILLGITRFIFGVITSIVIFKVGRRPLALTSSLGVAASCMIVGIYILHTKGPTVFPQICYTFTIIFSSCGYYTLPQLIISELYPLQVRGILGGFSTSINYFLIFASNKTYPYMVQAVGFAYTVICFGLCSLFGFVFLYLCLPETKGLTLQDIEEYYNKKRSTLVRIPTALRQININTDERNSEKKEETGKEEKAIKDNKDGGSTSHPRPKNKEG